MLVHTPGEPLARGAPRCDDGLVDRAIDPELIRRVRAGEYAVDPHAVADAILRRRADRATAERLSRVLEAREVDGPVVGSDEQRPAPGRD